MKFFEYWQENYKSAEKGYKIAICAMAVMWGLLFVALLLAGFKVPLINPFNTAIVSLFSVIFTVAGLTIIPYLRHEKEQTLVGTEMAKLKNTIASLAGEIVELKKVLPEETRKQIPISFEMLLKLRELSVNFSHEIFQLNHDEIVAKRNQRHTHDENYHNYFKVNSMHLPKPMVELSWRIYQDCARLVSSSELMKRKWANGQRTPDFDSVYDAMGKEIDGIQVKLTNDIEDLQNLNRKTLGVSR